MLIILPEVRCNSIWRILFCYPRRCQFVYPRAGGRPNQPTWIYCYFKRGRSVGGWINESLTIHWKGSTSQESPDFNWVLIRPPRPDQRPNCLWFHSVWTEQRTRLRCFMYIYFIQIHRASLIEHPLHRCQCLPMNNVALAWVLFQPRRECA